MSPATVEGQSLDQALEGLKVLEFPGVAASFCGFVLGSHGADVTKIEPLDGDPQRRLVPLIEDVHGERTSASFLAYNRGKSSIFLDAMSPEGRVQLNTLLGDADVVILNEGPGALGGLLDYARLRELNPGVILTTITPFGTTGPYADYTGGDLVSSAMSGFVHLTGEPGGEPVRMGGEQALKLGGAEAAAGTMVALFHRDSTGRGQHVDLAIRDAMIRATVNAIPRFEYENIVQNRVGDHWGVREKPLRALWRCADGWVSFVRRGGVLGGRVNQQCVGWMNDSGMDVGDLATVDWDAMDMGNHDHRQILDRLDELFDTFLAGRGTDATFTEGLARGITLAPVRRLSEVLEDEHLRQRGFWSGLEVASGTLRVPGRFVRTTAQEPPLFDSPTALPRWVPTLNQRTEAGSHV